MSAGLGLGHAISLPVCDTCVDVKIATQPANTTVDIGATASFTVVPSGTAPFTYQWERSTDNGATWSPILGATAATLNLPAVEYGANGYLYRATVSNCGATVVSASAQLTVNFNPIALSPTLWLDSTSGAGVQSWTNLGTGGSVLDARNGSGVGPDTNDALLLARTTENYLYLPGVSNNGIVLAPSPALNITGDIDLRVHVALDDWTPSAGATLIGKSNNTAATQSFILLVEASGAIRLIATDSALVSRNFTSSVAPTIADGSALWIRATLDVNNGAGGSTATFYTSTNGAVWTQLGTTVTIAATFTINPALTTGVTIGAYQTAGQVPATGKFYRAQVLDGINGTTALDVDFTIGLVSGAQTSLSISGTAADQLDNALVLTNLGTGGPLLNAQRGSNATAADTNEPLMLSHTGTNYVYVPGLTGNNLTMVSDTSNAFTTEVDYIVRMDRLWSGTGTNGGVIGRFGASSGAHVGMANSNGTVGLTLHDGTAYVSVNCSAQTSGEGARWLRVTWRSSDGRVQFFFNADQPTVPTVWTQLGVNATLAAGATIAQSAAEFFIAGSATSGFAPAKVLYASAAKTIGGVPTVLVDTSVITTGAATSFTATTGQTVTINRSTSGRKSVAVVQPTLLFGTDDYMEVANNDLLNFGATDSFTVMAAGRYWNNQGGGDVMVAKKANLTNTTLGWSLGNGSLVALGGQAQIGDGALGLTATSPARTVGALATTTMVRNVTTDQVTVYTDTTAGTPVTDTTTGTLANTEAVRIGRLSGAGAEYADMEFYGAAVWRRALSAAEIATVSGHYNGTVTPASLALLGEAVFWVDPARSKQAAVIARSTSGRKSVAVVKPVYLFGTDDYMEIADNALLDFGPTDPLTLYTVTRRWGIARGVLVDKAGGFTAAAVGWLMYYETDGFIYGEVHDGTFGPFSRVAYQASPTLDLTTFVRNVTADTVQTFRSGISGTLITDSTTGTLANANPVRIGRSTGVVTNYLDGEVMVVILVRGALTPAQVALLNTYYRTLFP